MNTWSAGVPPAKQWQRLEMPARCRRSMVFLLLVAATLACHAQTDTIAITGTVYNQQTLKPEPYCLVQLLQDSVAKAVRVCDEDGFFFIDSLPTGSYTLRVGVGRVTLFQNDFELRESANLSILVDTLQLISLRPITINARRWVPPMPMHRLEEQHLIISDADDYRLWNFSGRMTDSGPACADLSRGEDAGLLYQAEVEKKKSYNHLWHTAPIPATPRRKARTAPSDSTATGQK